MPHVFTALSTAVGTEGIAIRLRLNVKDMGFDVSNSDLDLGNADRSMVALATVGSVHEHA